MGTIHKRGLNPSFKGQGSHGWYLTMSNDNAMQGQFESIIVLASRVSCGRVSCTECNLTGRLCLIRGQMPQIATRQYKFRLAPCHSS